MRVSQVRAASWLNTKLTEKDQTHVNTLRQVARAGSLIGAARHDNLKRRSPDLTAFAGDEVEGFLRLWV